MKTSKLHTNSQKLVGEVHMARMQVARAANASKAAEKETKLAKRRRKEAKREAKRARKQAKQARADLAEARKALAKAEAKLAKSGTCTVAPKTRKRLVKKTAGASLKKIAPPAPSPSPESVKPVSPTPVAAESEIGSTVEKTPPQHQTS